MITSLSLCWLATGLWVLSDARRARRVWAQGLGPLPAWLLRVAAPGLLLAAVLPLAQLEGSALAAAGVLLALMVALSAAVLLFPLRPRWYTASVAAAGVAALLSALPG